MHAARQSFGSSSSQPIQQHPPLTEQAQSADPGRTQGRHSPKQCKNLASCKCCQAQLRGAHKGRILTNTQKTIRKYVVSKGMFENGRMAIDVAQDVIRKALSKGGSDDLPPQVSEHDVEQAYKDNHSQNKKPSRRCVYRLISLLCGCGLFKRVARRVGSGIKAALAYMGQKLKKVIPGFVKKRFSKKKKTLRKSTAQNTALVAAATVPNGSPDQPITPPKNTPMPSQIAPDVQNSGGCAQKCTPILHTTASDVQNSPQSEKSPCNTIGAAPKSSSNGQSQVVVILEKKKLDSSGTRPLGAPSGPAQNCKVRIIPFPASGGENYQGKAHQPDGQVCPKKENPQNLASKPLAMAVSEAELDLIDQELAALSRRSPPASPDAALKTPKARRPIPVFDPKRLRPEPEPDMDDDLEDYLSSAWQAHQGRQGALAGPSTNPCHPSPPSPVGKDFDPFAAVARLRQKQKEREQSLRARDLHPNKAGPLKQPGVQDDSESLAIAKKWRLDDLAEQMQPMDTLETMERIRAVHRRREEEKICEEQVQHEVQRQQRNARWEFNKHRIPTAKETKRDRNFLQRAERARADDRLPKKSTTVSFLDDHLLADATFCAYELRKIPYMRDVSVVMMTKRRYSRGVWRMAVAQAISMWGGQIERDRAAYTIATAENLAKGDGHDPRKRSWFNVKFRCPVAMAFCGVLR